MENTPHAVSAKQILSTGNTLPINEYLKTIEGKKLVLDQFPFCLGGTVYQSLDGATMPCEPQQLSEHEIKNVVIDVDGTLGNVLFIREQRDSVRASTKSDELAVRGEKKMQIKSADAQMRLALHQLRLIEGGEAPQDQAIPGSVPDADPRMDAVEEQIGELGSKLDRLINALTNQQEPAEEAVPVSVAPRIMADTPEEEDAPDPNDPAPDLGIHRCGACGKIFTSKRSLGGHRVGTGHTG